MRSTAPNTSLYVKNIDNKIKKPELRAQLYALFTTYGRVLDVVCTRACGMTGQAFIVFSDLASATAALRGLEGFEFYNKPLSIDYAQTKSKATILHELGHEALFDPKIVASMHKSADATSTTTGAATTGGKMVNAAGRVTFSSAEGGATATAEKAKAAKRARDEEEEAEEEDEEDGEGDAERSRKVARTEGNRTASSATASASVAKAAAPTEAEDEEEEEMQMEDDEEEEQTQESESKQALGPPIAEEGDAPSDTVFCPALPAAVSEDMLETLFKQYDGFLQATLSETTIEQKPKGRSKKVPAPLVLRNALVAFDSKRHATEAKEALDGFQVDKKVKLKVTWAARGDVKA